MGSYKELKVYTRSYEVAKRIYLRAQQFPADERYGLTSQVKRAATSIPLNIAEGYGKGAGENELIRFLRMAKGSVSEMEVLLDFCGDFAHISEEEHEEYKRQYEEIGKMLSGLIESIGKRKTNS